MRGIHLNLSISFTAIILRKAKSNNQVSCFISGEAIHLARDFGYVCETEFPSRQVGEYLCRNHSDPSELYRRKELFLATK